ncbi:MAG: ABC transporter ATP-binding protein [Gemmataceae bacterium]
MSLEQPSPAILACGVSKSFGTGAQRVPVLERAGLGIHRGEMVFLVGPSGSGKTTLLSILGCILAADEGTVRILGEDVTRLDPEALTAFRRRHLGFVFQTFNLFPTLSALDNVSLAQLMQGVSLEEAERRGRALLAQVGLQHRLHARPPQLSTGECQRVAVARALANNPAILLADEPTASLDAASGQALMLLLASLVKQRGMTLVAVTHDNRIFDHADRILHLEERRLVRATCPRRRAPRKLSAATPSSTQSASRSA